MKWLISLPASHGVDLISEVDVIAVKLIGAYANDRA